MEATEKRISPQLRRLLGTRSGTLALAAAAAVLAGIVLIAYLSHYRNSVQGGTTPETALVAGALIPKGTSGDVVISEQLYRSTKLAADKLTDGAVASTAAVAGKVATRDIYPGEQLSTSDFAVKADPIRGRLTGDQRAVAVPLDSSHGLIGNVRSGDHVDVLAGFNAVGSSGANRPVLRTLLQNVLVLQTPKGTAGGLSSATRTGSVLLRVTDRQAAALAFAADNGKVWLSLRSPAGASQEQPSVVDLQAILQGSVPVQGAGR
jgi:Flp pilus assembly protein CpaB